MFSGLDISGQKNQFTYVYLNSFIKDTCNDTKIHLMAKSNLGRNACFIAINVTQEIWFKIPI